MKLVSFRVQMFRSVLDSGEIRVSPLSVIVGKNESGKTSLLKALHLLNPALPEPYRLDVEWPRGARDRRSPDHAPCMATFDLTSDDQAKLITVGAISEGETQIRLGRTFANKLSVDGRPTLDAAVEQTIAELMPKFVYMDEYQYFSGAARLDQVRQRVQQKTTTPEDKALITLLSLGALDLASLVDSGNHQDREQRRYDLSDAGATITERLAKHWKALAYEVKFEADGQQFWTFVKSPLEKALIKLEERSRGFQWFFSFDAKLMHETRGDLKNCVILLDEPGLHLHAGAQRDLLARLEEYAEGNTMIYTTHLPFMIDLREPDRIRALDATATGPVVTENLFESSPEAKLTLQAALGMTGRLGMPVGDVNLTVEGVHDYWFLTALSDLLERKGKPHLPAGVVITACGGATEVTYLSTFMVGQGLHVVALYDADAEGRAAKDKFLKSWLARYKGGRADAITLGDIIGETGDTAIEDLFPEKFYLDAVLGQYGRQLPEGAGGKLDLSSGGSLAVRVQRALGKFDISFNKGSVAKALCTKIRSMKSFDELPKETVERAERLFAELSKRFETS